MVQKQLYLGRTHYVDNGFDMSNEFEVIAGQDEKTAKLLHEQGFYNQSVYYYIQSMEKYIKSFICKKIDITNAYYDRYSVTECNHFLTYLLFDNFHFYKKGILSDYELLRNESP